MFGDPVKNTKGWKTESLQQVAPAKPAKNNLNDKVWLLNLDMVESQTGKVIDYLYVNISDTGNSTYQFDEGNVLYSKLRPYLNKVVIPEQSGICTSELVPLRPTEKLNRYFLANLLRTDFFVNFINEKVAGAKMPRVLMDTFRAFDCILPPIELQNDFAAFVQQIGKSKFEMAIYEKLWYNY
ncbi:MAG: restriction endonuclease subunit S [Treponema sp.]|nr:restriction endonuclease subunit S [Treponema sp.]